MRGPVAQGCVPVGFGDRRRGLRPDRVRGGTEPAQNIPGMLSACQFRTQKAHLASIVLRERLPDRLLQLLHALLESDQMLVHAGMLAVTRDAQFCSSYFGVQSRAHKAPPVPSYASLPEGRMKA